jgi:hypothetical protein
MRSVADIPATAHQRPRFDSLMASSALTQCDKVDFPEPEGPTNNTISPMPMLFALETDHAAERRGHRQAQHHFEFTGV